MHGVGPNRCLELQFSWSDHLSVLSNNGFSLRKRNRRKSDDEKLQTTSFQHYNFGDITHGLSLPSQTLDRKVLNTDWIKLRCLKPVPEHF